jgi:cytochrome c oxidase cbb3-type subunit III
MTIRQPFVAPAVAVLSLTLVLAMPIRAGSQAGAGAVKPLTDAKSLAAGKSLFENVASLCITCHKPDLGGLVGPDLTDDYWLNGCGVGDVMTSIRDGSPTKGMLPYGGGPKLTDTELQQIASYILSRRGAKPSGAKPRDAAREKLCK